MAQVRVLTLDKNQFQESVLYRLEKGWFLRFTLGPTLMGHEVRLYTNYPAESYSFDRSKWRQLEWVLNSKYKNDDLDKYAEFECHVAGAFGYNYVTVSKGKEEKCGSGYVQIAPTLRLGPELVELPIDCIQCQTMLAKCMGPFPEWEARLRVPHESGYNMVHITPVNTLGLSNSSYSLKNHLELNPLFSKGQHGKQYTFDELKALTHKLKHQWGMLVISDVVYNHTSDDTVWLKEHPDCAFNLKNSPHLRPAFILDRHLANFGRSVAQNVYDHRGLPALITEECHLHAMRSILLEDILVQPKFHEFFQVNVDNLVGQFSSRLGHYHYHGEDDSKSLWIIQDPEYRRYGCSVDIDLALRKFGKLGWSDEAVANFRQNLLDLNNHAAGECWRKLVNATEALMGHVRYQRVDPHGYLYRDYNSHHPLFSIYFTNGPLENADLRTVESVAYDDTKNSHCMAYNGWVMGDDPLRNFAESPSTVYFERALICWGDSVKLRYGQKPEDSPFLWDYMKQYTKLSAETFHGFRIDNCHSTPIHVAEYLLDYARTINPELYICAELFTGNDQTDNIFVNKLGITSLIREVQVAPTVWEESRLIYRYGGDPVGAFIQKNVRPLTSCIAHAMFMDLTHDNPSPIKKRTIYDLLPTAALVSSACCSVGSNRGYDEFVAYHIHVVDEERLYCKWSDEEKLREGEVNMMSGIIAARRMINDLHWEMGAEGFNEIYVDKMTEDVIAVTRHNPKTRQSVVIVASTCFSPSRIQGGRGSYPKPLHIFGNVDEIIFEAKIMPSNTADPDGRPKDNTNKKFLIGSDDFRLDIKTHVKLFNSKMVEIVRDERVQVVEFKRFPTGSVMALKVSMLPEAKNAVRQLRSHLNEFGYRLRSHSIDTGAATEQLSKGTNFGFIISKMNMQDFNRVLFRSHAEEADEGKGGGAFFVNNIGHFFYCGLAGVIPHFTFVRTHNDLGHPLCGNVRDNDWLIRYIANRLLDHPGTSELGHWFDGIINGCYIHLPHYLKPCYMEAIVSGAFNAICEKVKSKMSSFVQQSSEFVYQLALGSVVFTGYSKSAPLPPLADNIELPHPPSGDQNEQVCTTISAGLPHFATGLFRNWGRDTFIALPGILLIPGRYDEARYIILAFAGCLRHGLLPNLLGGGRSPRYNCRDSVWWWLHAIRDYVRRAPDGQRILNDSVRRLFADDEAPFDVEGRCQPLHETIYEALSRHFDGIEFRERNAGPAIDEHMADEGFDLTVGVDTGTGFVFGGNASNCGTWMDKMGGSAKAGNKGHPATPRDGSAVELVGLCYESVSWLHELHTAGGFPHSGVVRKSDGFAWTWKQWADTIKHNFERCFWIPEHEHEYFDSNVTDAKLIAQRGIYKDSFKASTPWADYQFRPNFCVALAVAPDLVDLHHAKAALLKAKERLMGPLGIKTLDESDLAYNGYYNNDDDSANYNTAQGFNYHQGPEWLWVAGYFLMAQLRIAKLLNGQMPNLMSDVMADVKVTLSNHYTHLTKSDWKSLPELTNRDGHHCHASCAAQAWSVGCFCEVMYELSLHE